MHEIKNTFQDLKKKINEELGEVYDTLPDGLPGIITTLGYLIGNLDERLSRLEKPVEHWFRDTTYHPEDVVRLGSEMYQLKSINSENKVIINSLGEYPPDFLDKWERVFK